MKCLTVCQPWPWCILRAGKRVENRTWTTGHRGETLLHAGLSQEWLGSADRELELRGMREPPKRDLVFGAIVALANLIDCVDRETALHRYPAQRLWINGPYCFVLADEIREFERPIRFKGQQGLFEVPDGVVAAAMGRVVPAGAVWSEPPADAGLGFDQAAPGGGTTETFEFKPRETTGRLWL